MHTFIYFDQNDHCGIPTVLLVYLNLTALLEYFDLTFINVFDIDVYTVHNCWHLGDLCSVPLVLNI